MVEKRANLTWTICRSGKKAQRERERERRHYAGMKTEFKILQPDSSGPLTLRLSSI